jgi:hypothetical protein
MHLGDPLAMIELMFKQFEVPVSEDRLPKLSGYTNDFLMFTEKLKALDEQFDIAVSARLAKILVE